MVWEQRPHGWRLERAEPSRDGIDSKLVSLKSRAPFPIDNRSESRHIMMEIIGHDLYQKAKCVYALHLEQCCDVRELRIKIADLIH